MKADFRTFLFCCYSSMKYSFIIWTTFKIDRWHRYPFATIHQYCNSKRLLHKNALAMKADFRTCFVLLVFINEYSFVIWTTFKIDRWHIYPFATFHQYCNSKRLIQKMPFQWKLTLELFLFCCYSSIKYSFIIWTTFKIDRSHRYPIATIHQYCNSKSLNHKNAFSMKADFRTFFVCCYSSMK
jgi:hypothetical protein